MVNPKTDRLAVAPFFFFFSFPHGDGIINNICHGWISKIVLWVRCNPTMAKRKYVDGDIQDEKEIKIENKKKIVQGANFTRRLFR